ncbi:MAG TPA: M20/M25/M40 family metallo-hydrolase [Candidatus Hydrogenedentes bacterium]|nr:M20/M25/M40 family metallo-hydrolase [Candidatus Hydrogenedentota bacterium]HPG69594.1 M20/M25/M40 family metallo-hydrolase [Candidatus Hydrogenedentota bacterium]
MTKTVIDRDGLLCSGMMAVLLSVLVAVSLYPLMPPRAVPGDAPETEFSAQRAFQHIQAACTEPHAAATAANRRVIEYIVSTAEAMGAHPETFSVTLARGNTFDDVTNVLVRLRGSAPTKAVMIVAHHDSVQWGPGASDDFGGCAAMLETIRALLASPPLKNDIIFMFTDAEERGLVGAEAFCLEHPWMADVALVLNFEARGTCGPSLMFETGPDNGWLIPHFVKAASHAVASSLMADVYLKMPTTTDYKIFKRYGLQGLGCAYIRNLAYYHTPNDSPENVNLGSLQQHGYYAIDVARYFGSIPLEDIREPNAVYFNLVGHQLVCYPGSWVVPLTVVVLLLVLAVLALGFIRRRLTGRGVLLGVAALVTSALCAALLAAGFIIVAWLVYNRGTGMPLFRHGMLDANAWISENWHLLYQNTKYFVACVALTLYVVSVFHIAFRKRVKAEELLAGAVIVCVPLLVGVTFLFEGGAYLVQWSLIGICVALAATILRREDANDGVGWAVFLSLCAAPALLLILPSLFMMNDATGAVIAPAVMFGMTLLFSMLSLHLAVLARPWRWAVPVVSGVAAVTVFITALLLNGTSAGQPLLKSVAYGLDLDRDQAYWISSDHRLDAWQRQFFPEAAERQSIAEFIPGEGSAYLKAPAPKAVFSTPTLEVIEDQRAEDHRSLRLRLDTPDRPPRLHLSLPEGIQVLEATVNGKPAARAAHWSLNYRNYARESSDLTLVLKTGGESVELTAVECFLSLPKSSELGYEPMPDYVILEPNTVDWHRDLRSNSSFVRKTFALP